MCALLSLTATSHCLQEEKKTSKAAVKKEKDKGKEAVKEEPKAVKEEPKAVTKKLSKAEAKEAEAKVEEAKVVDQPLDEDGNPVPDDEECTVTMVEDPKKRKRTSTKR
jgi:hypothetical protein